MKDSKPLQAHRKEIDKIDDDIVRLLNERARHVIEIGNLKKAADTQPNLHTPAREAEILERLCK
jgi:chorismate mutase/prephenate dehydratase